ncbi:MAG: rhodanese-like domain-containing protein [Candidatus Solibacter sp.]|nr:rhodanese-like domain-containing protein [Candidatus Solibacter sp.]
MYRRIPEMGGNFTGVKNQKLTRLAAVLAAVVMAVVTVTAAADMALVQPRELAAQLAAKGVGPVVFMVGPNVLYRSRHIAGSVFAGPGQSAAGLAMLQAEAGKLPRDREVVVYCGCCPWSVCPNVKPAVALLKQMGFTKAKALYLSTGFKTDWLDKGYAAESPR